MREGLLVGDRLAEPERRVAELLDRGSGGPLLVGGAQSERRVPDADPTEPSAKRRAVICRRTAHHSPPTAAGPIGIGRPARPRAGVQGRVGEPGEAQRQQIVAGGDARPARGDDAGAVGDAERLVPATEVLGGQEPPAHGVEVAGPGRVPGAGDVAGSRVDSGLDPAVALERPRVEQDAVLEDVVDLVRLDEPALRPRPRREAGHLRCDRLAREIARPACETTVEDGCAHADGVEHPPQARGDRARGIVVRDDGVVVADPERGHRRGEALRGR